MSTIYSDKLTREDLLAIAERMPIQVQGSNGFDLGGFEGARRRRISVSLRPVHGEAGERWRKVRVDQFTGRERRVSAVSWGGHYVFWSAVLALDPNAEIKSVLAHWKGADDFYARVGETGHANWGSQFYPQYAAEMCHDPLPERMLEYAGRNIAEAARIAKLRRLFG